MLTLADKLNTVASALREIKQTAKLPGIADPLERNAAMIQNAIQSAKIAATLRVQGSIDAMFENVFNQITLQFAVKSARYCESKGINEIDDMADFAAWLAVNDDQFSETIHAN
jgi:hypothetical protein